MMYDHFVGKVQHLARLPTRNEAERAIAATLESLGARMIGGTAHNLAAQLPVDVGKYLVAAEPSADLTVHDFFVRVSHKEGTGLMTAAQHARAVIDVLREAVSAGVFAHVRDQLPDEWKTLLDSHSEGSHKPMAAH